MVKVIDEFQSLIDGRWLHQGRLDKEWKASLLTRTQFVSAGARWAREKGSEQC
jgi:hypothetical protein